MKEVGGCGDRLDRLVVEVGGSHQSRSIRF